MESTLDVDGSRNSFEDDDIIFLLNDSEREVNVELNTWQRNRPLGHTSGGLPNPCQLWRSEEGTSRQSRSGRRARHTMCHVLTLHHTELTKKV